MYVSHWVTSTPPPLVNTEDLKEYDYFLCIEYVLYSC